jgi:hypothetical protein
LCVAEPPLSCAEGHRCSYGAVCLPSAAERDQHGCVHIACRDSVACGGGECVKGRCFDRAGSCEEIPVNRESAPLSPAEEPVACPGEMVEVTRCVTGGKPIMTDQGPRANRSCTKQCEPGPIAGSPGMPCAQRGPRRYTCEAYAP